LEPQRALRPKPLKADPYQAGAIARTKPGRRRAGVSVRTATTITGIGAGSITGHDRYGEPWSAACDGIVLVTQLAPQDSLYTELAGDQPALAAAGISGLYRIGDAVAPRMISGAIFDGHRLAQEINQEGPAQPSPCQRERADLT
jgi:dimethylamine/trimethylamine dehydrogenase